MDAFLQFKFCLCRPENGEKGASFELQLPEDKRRELFIVAQNSAWPISWPDSIGR